MLEEKLRFHEQKIRKQKDGVLLCLSCIGKILCFIKFSEKSNSGKSSSSKVATNVQGDPFIYYVRSYITRRDFSEKMLHFAFATSYTIIYRGINIKNPPPLY